MSTIYDYWPGPIKQDYFVATAWLERGVNLHVNGMLLPSDQDYLEQSFLNGVDLVCGLREANKDWCPFFGSVKNLNSFIQKLQRAFQVDSSMSQVGFYFDAEREEVSVVTRGTYKDDGEEPSHVWVTYHFSTPLQVISRSLSTFEPRNPICSFNSLLFYDNEYAPDDWSLSGTSTVTRGAYLKAKGIFEGMYGTSLSECDYDWIV